MLTERTGLTCLGVLPWLHGVWLDAEDTLEVGAWRSSAGDVRDHDRLRVAVVRLPRVSNVTDVEALAAEPGVEVLVTTDPRRGRRRRPRGAAGHPRPRCPTSPGCARPGWPTRSSTEPADGAARARHLRRLPDAGPDDRGRPWRAAWDRSDAVDGLGLLPVAVRFGEDKTLGRPVGVWAGHPVAAYEIHHGVADACRTGGADGFLDGWRAGSVWGTMWHGTLENDGFRRAWLAEIAAAAGRLETATRSASLRRPARDHDHEHGRRGRGAPRPRPAASPDQGRRVMTVLVVGIGSGEPGPPDRRSGRRAERGRRVPGGRQARRDPRPRHDPHRAVPAVITGDRYRFIEVPDPERDRTPSGYREAVADWHARRAAAYADVIRPRAAGRRHSRLPGLGRPVALRQHAADRRAGPRQQASTWRSRCPRGSAASSCWPPGTG